MKILITRPEPDASSLAALFPSATSIILPLLEIKLLNHLPEYQPEGELIFVSKNAVLGYPGRGNQSPCFAVGATTARALQEKGFTQVIYPHEAEGSEALLNLVQLQKIQGKRFVIICGVDSRDQLEKTLQKRGAKVSHLITYQTHFRSLSPAEIENIKKIYDIIIVTSSHALRHLATLAQEYNSNLFQIPVTVLQGSMLQSAESLGFKKPLIVKSFNNEHLRHLSANHYSRR